jgi:hypothetical protein
MRQFIIAPLLVSGLCFANPLSAQQTVSSVSSVRLAFQKVDQVALDFGVDTAVMRRRAVERLGAAGIAVVQDPNQPELSIAVRVPKQLAPVDQGFLRVEMRLLEPTSSNPRRELWNARGSAIRFTTFGSLRQLVPEQLEQRLDSLAAAHSGT